MNESFGENLEMLFSVVKNAPRIIMCFAHYLNSAELSFY